MKNSTLDKPFFTNSFKALKNTEKRIVNLKEECNKYYQELDGIVRKSLIDYNWKPKYNEKAVYITLDDRDASHVWFLEEDTDYFRFREAPNEYTNIRHFCRQRIIPSEINERHHWIIPMQLFQELNSIVGFNFIKDKHETWHQ